MARTKKEVKEPTIWEDIKTIWSDLWAKAKAEIKFAFDLFKEGIVAFLEAIYCFVYSVIDITISTICSFLKSIWRLTVDALIKWVQHL